MEQKRTLWIIAAVGVFLLVVLGAALILYSPNVRSSNTIANYQSTKKNSDNGWISLDSSENIAMQNQDNGFHQENKENLSDSDFNFPKGSENESSTEKQVAKVGEITLYADNVTFKNDSNFAEKTNVPPTVINNTTTIDVTSNRKAEPFEDDIEKPKVTFENKAEQKTNDEKVPSVQPKVTNTVTVKTNPKPSKPAVQETKKVSETKPAAQETKKTVTTTQYWVQVTSLTSRKNADAAREVLSENKIPADVFTYTDSKDQLFYRVRVGPYTTKSEAEYWQTRIAKIDNFKNSKSYVAQTQVTQ